MPPRVPSQLSHCGRGKSSHWGAPRSRPSSCCSAAATATLGGQGDEGTRPRCPPTRPRRDPPGTKKHAFHPENEQPKAEGSGCSGTHGRTKPSVTPRPPLRGTPQGQGHLGLGAVGFPFFWLLQKSPQVDPFQTWWFVSEGKKGVGGVLAVAAT